MHHCTDEKKPTGDGNPTAGGTDRAIVPDTTSTSNTTSIKTGHRFLALNKALNELVLRVWCATPSSWGRGTIRSKAKAPVLENTFGQAVAAPTDKRGFVIPKFSGLVRLHLSRMVYGRGGGYPQGRPHGLSRVFNHHAHPLRVKTQRVVLKSRQGATTMTASPVASRSAAPTTPTTGKTPTHFDPVATHGEAVNAAAMARWYAARHNYTAAARKAVQALAALRKLAAFERSEVTA